MTSAQKQATQTTRIMHASDQIIHKKRPSALGLSMLLIMPVSAIDMSSALI